MKKLGLITALTLAGVAILVQPASARKLCNIYNQCWEVIPWEISQAETEKLLGTLKPQPVTAIKPAKTDMRKTSPIRNASAR